MIVVLYTAVAVVMIALMMKQARQPDPNDLRLWPAWVGLAALGALVGVIDGNPFVVAGWFIAGLVWLVGSLLRRRRSRERAG